MSNYNLTQKLNKQQGNDNVYDDDICAEVAEGQFIAVTANTIAEGAAQREMTVQIMLLPQSPGGKICTNSGAYVRQEGETSVKATLLDDSGKEVDSNVVNY